MKRKKWTKNRLAVAMAEIKNLTESGKPLKLALKAAKMDPSTYYRTVKNQQQQAILKKWHEDTLGPSPTGLEWEKHRPLPADTIACEQDATAAAIEDALNLIYGKVPYGVFMKAHGTLQGYTL